MRYLFGELNPVLPTQWRAQVDYLALDLTPWHPDKTVVHYGGNASFAGGPIHDPDLERRALRIYEQAHLSRGWTGIAYNYAIGQTGSLYVLRGEQRSGATSGDYENDGIPENEEARAVLFILGGDQEPSPEAIATFHELLELTPESSRTVIGHREVKHNTRCPGPAVMAVVEETRTNEGEPTMTLERWVTRLRPTDIIRMKDIKILLPHEAEYWGDKLIEVKNGAPVDDEWADLRDAVTVRSPIWAG